MSFQFSRTSVCTFTVFMFFAHSITIGVALFFIIKLSQVTKSALSLYFTIEFSTESIFPLWLLFQNTDKSLVQTTKWHVLENRILVRFILAKYKLYGCIQKYKKLLFYQTESKRARRKMKIKQLWQFIDKLLFV